MTDEEKKIAEEKAAAELLEAQKAAIDPIEAKDAEIAKLKSERDNYKTVALKRLGKLEGDAEFMGVDKESGLTVEEQVKKTLLDREIARIEQEKDQKLKVQAREIAELKLTLKNRPSTVVAGGDSDTTGKESKDNVFSEEQLKALRERAIRLKADPEKFIENAKNNFRKTR